MQMVKNWNLGKFPDMWETPKPHNSDKNRNLNAKGIKRYVSLTNNCQHAGGLGGPGVTFVLGLIVKHWLVDDEDSLDSLSNNLVLLSFPDLAAVLEPANLKDQSKHGGQSIMWEMEVIFNQPSGWSKISNNKTLTNFTVHFFQIWLLFESTVDRSHLGGFAGHFTFKLGRFLLSDLYVLQRLRKLNMRSWRHKDDAIIKHCQQWNLTGTRFDSAA